MAKRKPQAVLPPAIVAVFTPDDILAGYASYDSAKAVCSRLVRLGLLKIYRKGRAGKHPVKTSFTLNRQTW